MNRKRIGRRLCLGIALALLLSVSSPVFATAAAPEDAYAHLLEIGFPADFLDAVSDEFLLELYADSAAAGMLVVEASDPAAAAHAGIAPEELEFRLVTAKAVRGGVVERIHVYLCCAWSGRVCVTPRTDSIRVTWDSELWLYQPNSLDAAVYADSGLYASTSTLFDSGFGTIGWDVSLPGMLQESPYGCASFELIPCWTLQPDGTDQVSTVTAEYTRTGGDDGIRITVQAPRLPLPLMALFWLAEACSGAFGWRQYEPAAAAPADETMQIQCTVRHGG